MNQRNGGEWEAESRRDNNGSTAANLVIVETKMQFISENLFEYNIFKPRNTYYSLTVYLPRDFSSTFRSISMSYFFVSFGVCVCVFFYLVRPHRRRRRRSHSPLCISEAAGISYNNNFKRTDEKCEHMATDKVSSSALAQLWK